MHVTNYVHESNVLDLADSLEQWSKDIADNPELAKKASIYSLLMRDVCVLDEDYQKCELFLNSLIKKFCINKKISRKKLTPLLG